MDIQTLANKVASRSFPLEFPGHWITNERQLHPKAPVVKESINPNDNQLLMSVTLDRHTIHQAIDSSVSCLNTLTELSFTQRIEYLQKFRQVMSDYNDLFVDASRIECGKPKWEAQQEFSSALRYLDWICENCESIEQALLAPAKLGSSKGDYELLPIGVSLAFLPFSTPINNLVHYLSASIVAGSPLTMVVSGHATITGLAASFIAEMIELPPGALNLVIGNFTTLKQVLGDRRIKAILYTGSREHCQIIRQESRSIIERQLILQSGGKNAVLVHSSADIPTAVSITLQGLTRSTGQLCTSTSRVMVYSTKFKEFCDALVAATEALRIGRTDSNELEDPEMGPLYSKKAVDKFLRFQTMANREAKETLLWGKAVETAGDGYFVRPGLHIMDSVDSKSALQTNVLFSPDLCIYQYDVLDDAITQINSTDAHFAVSFVGDRDILAQRRRRFLAPNLRVNLATVEEETTLALAGRLHSGHHRYNGIAIALLLSYPQVIETR